MLGSALLDLCRKQGIEAIGTLRKEADVTDLFGLIEKSHIIQPTHIINCAAYTDVDGAEKNPELAFAVNAMGAGNIAQAARAVGARLIHISTDYVFNGKSSAPYQEEDICDPTNTYGHSKRAGELKVLETLPSASIVRTSWLFGSKGKNFISTVFQWLQDKEELQVVSDQCGKPTYCHDLAEAIFLLLDVQGIVHFANEGGHSRYQIALDVLQAAKNYGLPMKCKKITPVLAAQFPTPAVRPAYTVLDTNKYYHLTNLRPRPWSQVINEFLNAL